MYLECLLIVSFFFFFFFISLFRYIPLQATSGASDQAGAADNDGDDQLLALPSLCSR
jgi:hypothetical protein